MRLVGVHVVVWVALGFAGVSAWGSAPAWYVMTVGPGEAVYERFGHNGLMAIDPATGDGVVYDWGRFDFDQPGFIARFLRGRMLYSTGREDADATLGYYADVLGRDVRLLELDLTPEESARLLAACEKAYLPENRDYYYDYFLVNCSTKIRDRIDDAVGGLLADRLVGVQTGTTFRREAKWMVSPDRPIWYGFEVGFSRRADRPIDRWEQAFLPEKLHAHLLDVTREDGTSLVRREVRLADGMLPPPAGPRRYGSSAGLGVVLAASVGVAWSVGWRKTAAAVAAAWLALAGLWGTGGLMVWTTDHWPGHANQMILVLLPAGPLAGVAVAAGWRRGVRTLVCIHATTLSAAAVLHVIPGVGQDNLAALLLTVPPTVAALAVLWTWAAPARATPAPVG